MYVCCAQVNDADENPTFCLCLTTFDSSIPNTGPNDIIAGPLTYDFARDSKLVGRELIVPERV